MSVFLTEQLITRYSQIALSDNAITVNKTRLVNESRVKAKVQINQRERIFFVIGRIFRYQIGFRFRSRLEQKINMKYLYSYS